MDKTIYKDVKGIEEFFRFFPEVHWCYFHEMIEFRWYREVDYEEWTDRFCVDLTMSDIDGKDTILLKLKNVSGNCNCDFSGWISGLDIVNLKHIDKNHEIQYEILDFEDSQIHLYCKDIEIQVLRVNGEDVNSQCQEKVYE